jgi:hypothetical protein
MSYGSTPGEWQGDPAERPQGFGQPPLDQGQAWPTSPYSGPPGQQGQPSYGQPAAPGYFPPGYGAGPYGAPPPTHLVWARIAAAGGVLFSLILGLPAALIAMQQGRKVRPQWESGNQQAAISASHKARTWAIVSTVLDLLGVILVVIIFAAGVAASKSNFSNPAVVASSIKAQLQKSISDPSSPYYSAGLKVTSVACTKAGTNTDRCVIDTSNGQTASVTAVISADGRTYVTH